jgi:hypothetical protein
MKALKSLQSCDVRFVLGFDIDIRFGTIWEGFKEMQNISVGIFPTISRLNSVSQTNQFLPKVNSYAKQSSIGKQNRNAQYLICYPVLWQNFT